MLYILRENIPLPVKNDLAANNEELLSIEINRPKCKPLLIAATYKPLNVKKANFIDSLRDSFSKTDLEKNGLVLMGDSNIDQLGKRSASRLPKSFATENDVKQLINELTRITEYSKTLIDLIFTSREHKIVQSGTIHTTLSEHSLVFCVVKGGVPKLPPRKFEHRSFKKDNKMEFVHDLSQVPWSVIDGVENVSDAAFLWERLFSEIAHEHALLKIKRAKESKTPWVTSTLAEMKRDKDSQFRKARFINCTHNWKIYRNLRNSTNHEEKNLRSKYSCRIVEDAKGVSCET